MYVVYELLIDNEFHYGGCCNIYSQKSYDSVILNHSGNHLHKQAMRHLIPYSEYKKRCQVLGFEQFENKTEAEEREAVLIANLRAKYGDKCINQSLGNRYGQTGLTCSEESKQKRKEALLSRSKKVIQHDKEGKVIAEYQSISEAARQTGYLRNLIYCCCHQSHNVKSVHGYRFDFA